MRITCLYILLFTTSSLADAAPSIKTGFFKVKKEMPLIEVLTTQAGLPESFVNSKFIKFIKRYNSHLNSKLKPGDLIYIEIPSDLKIRNTLFNNKGKVVLDSFTSVPFKQYDLSMKVRQSLSLYFTTSYGSFNESFGQVNSQTDQNSPYTFGAAYSRTLNTKYSMSLSAYSSYLVDTNIKNSDESTDIPPEFGLTSYVNFMQSSLPITPYAGLDFESFSTFNIDERASGKQLDTREHRITFATIGAFKTFQLYEHYVSAKLSISQSILSHSSRKSTLSNKKFQGQKMMLFMGSPITTKVSGHFFFKQHFLKGATDLSITRAGVGISYRLF